MTSLPHPTQIRLRWKDNVHVWGWLTVLYRDPKFFRKQSDEISRGRLIRVLAVFLAHLMPWVLVVTFLISLTIRVGITSSNSIAEAATKALAISAINCIAICLVGGLIGGIFRGLAGGLAGGLAVGLVIIAASSLTGGLANDLTKSLTVGLAFGLTFGLAASVQRGLPGALVIGISGALVGGLQGGLVSCIAVPAGAWIGIYRLYRLLCPSAWWVRNHVINDWRRHPTIWDRNCLTWYPRMARRYLAWWEHEPGAVRQQLLRLIARNRFQRPAALKAFTAILARESAQFTSLSQLDRHLEQLPYSLKKEQPAKIREQAKGIAALQRAADATSVPLLRCDQLTLAREAIVPFRAYVSGCEEPLCTEFLRAADAWDATLARQIAALPQEVPDFFEENLYIQAGMQAFVRRDETLRELVGHLRDEAGGASLLLYARRRMGKSTLTENLARMLPPDLAAIRLSMQDAEVNTSEAHFAARLIAILGDTFPDADLAALRDDTLPPRNDLATFSSALRRLQAHLGATSRRVLISLDEFELMDERIAAGAMSVRLLAALRDAIQSHRRIRWLFSGVHHFSELLGAEWSSYLTAFREVNVRPFSLEETHQLLTEPMRHAQAYGDRTPAMAGFFVEKCFWPESMITRIQHETQGWPALVQGVAKQVIALCNRAKVLRPSDEILEGALDSVLDSMATTFQQLLLFSGNLQDLERRAGEYLRGFRSADTLPLPTDGDIRRLLERHELMTMTESGEWRLRVPLMLRWMRKRG
jgi:hypothetical protein